MHGDIFFEENIQGKDNKALFKKLQEFATKMNFASNISFYCYTRYTSSNPMEK